MPTKMLIFLLLHAFLPAPFAPVLAREFRDDLFSVSFPTAADGWACGRWGTILSTSDGGLTWSGQRSGTDVTLSSICFPDKINGWAAGDGGTILHTADGGRTWARQQTPVSGLITDILFTDPQHGWVTADRGMIVHTDNGGAAWRVQVEAGDFIFKSISFSDGGTGWAAGEYGLIYHTADRGAHWQRQAGRLPANDGREEAAQPLLYKIVALSPRRAIVVGGSGYVAQTDDGGARWNAVTPAITDAHLFCSAAADAQSYILGGTNLLARLAGGTTELTPCSLEQPLRYGWIYGISPIPGGGFAAVGGGGAIYSRSQPDQLWRRGRYIETCQQ